MTRPGIASTPLPTMPGLAKGWCPGAHRPMASGDGLLVRIRPRLARLTASQTIALCELAQGFGSGFIDLTNRANLQLRGVQPGDHAAVIEALCRLDLLDADATRERWPAILVAPCWQTGDDTERIATALAARLAELPALPPKFGFAVDAGPAPVLGAASADVRIERGSSGGLIVRAHGAAAGHAVTAADAVTAALAMATWFAATTASAEPAPRRMKLLLDTHTLPQALRPTEQPAAAATLPAPGVCQLGPVYGVAFGQIEATALARLLQDTGATALRLTPHRALILEGGRWRASSDCSTQADDPLLHIYACPGAPSCASATVATRDLARALVRDIARDISSGFAREATNHKRRSLHISGCAKGCARALAADITLVGRNGAFDLVRNGCAGDAPSHTGLAPAALRSLLGTL
ncbi:precorrin-3B synthase [soil metagenome]